METYRAARARDAGSAGPGGQHLQLGDGSDSGLRMPVRHRKTGLPAVVLGNLPAIACRGGWLSNLLGSLPAGVGHAFWNRGSGRKDRGPRAYTTSVKRLRFLRSQITSFLHPTQIEACWRKTC